MHKEESNMMNVLASASIIAGVLGLYFTGMKYAPTKQYLSALSSSIVLFVPQIICGVVILLK